MIRTAPLCLLALLTGCSSDLEYEGAFTLPSAGTVTAPDQPTPFDETVAYVASATGGQIRALGAESGRFLTDDPEASFLRGSPIATGRRRALSAVTSWSPSAEQLTVFAVDQAYGVLIEVPHVIGVEGGVPVEPQVSVSEVSASGSGSLTELEVHDGFATTEDWTLTWDGEVWRAQGSRSGQLDARILPGEAYTPTSQAFTLTATAGSEAGETLSFSTDSGLVEHVVGASDEAPIAVETAPDQSLLAVILHDDLTDTGRVVWWDPAGAEVAGEVELPEGRRPTALSFSEDRLWIADAAVGLDLDGEALGASLWSVGIGQTEATQHELPAPASMLEPVSSADRLYYVEVGSTDLRALQMSTGELIDLDPVRPDSMGFPLHGVIRGLAMLPGSFEQIDDDDDEVPRTSTDVIALSLYRGTVVFYDPATGCLLQDGLGPRSTSVSRTAGANAGDYEWDFDGAAGGPELALNEANNNHVVVNACAGIARGESWRLTYDDADLAWTVEGELSGVQQAKAYEGVRYVSDSGAVSFLIEPGSTPSSTGWTMQFTITDGILGLTGDQDDDGIINQANNEFTWSAPGAPLPVVLPAAGTRESPVPAVIVPLEGNDLVVRGRPDTGLTGAVWQ